MRVSKIEFEHTFNINDESLRVEHPWNDYELQPVQAVFSTSGQYVNVDLSGFRILKSGKLGQYPQHIPVLWGDEPEWLIALKEEAKKKALDIMGQPE